MKTATKESTQLMDISTMSRGIIEEIEAYAGEHKVTFVIDPNLYLAGSEDLCGYVLRSLLKESWYQTEGLLNPTVQIFGVIGGYICVRDNRSVDAPGKGDNVFVLQLEELAELLHEDGGQIVGVSRKAEGTSVYFNLG